MAIVRVQVTSNGRPTKGATLLFYDEDATVASGSEDSGFTDGDLATIYSDRAMSTSITQTTDPQTTDSNGECVVYGPSGSIYAVKVTRGTNTRWIRDFEVLQSDPI